MAPYLTREETDDFIHKLAREYPKCFFEDPRQRVPIKKSIAADLATAGFGATYDELVLVIQFYEQGFGYLYALQAGTKRVDLSGKAAGTVTEQEEMAAQRKIKEIKQKKRERDVAMLGATAIVNQLHSAGQITDCAVKQLDAPPLPVPVPVVTPPEKPHEPFATIREAIAAAETVMNDAPTRVRSTMAAAALRLVICEVEAMIRMLES